MLGFISYLLQVDRKTWDAFKKRLEANGARVNATLLAFIQYYIRHGSLPPEDPKEK